MANLAQIDANRANAQKSTGPRTPEGKAATSQNARKHGFYSPVATLSPDEREDYEALRDALAGDMRPAGTLEHELFERVAVACWHLRLATLRECELCAGPEDPWAAGSPAAATLANIQRCRRDLERSRLQSLAELRRLQTARALLALQPEGLAPLAQSAPLADQARLRASKVPGPSPKAPDPQPKPVPPARPETPLPNLASTTGAASPLPSLASTTGAPAPLPNLASTTGAPAQPPAKSYDQAKQEFRRFLGRP